MNVLAVIPARGGSRGVVDKNIRPLLGRPMLAYTLDHLRESKLVNRVVLSTEDPRIAAVARSLGVDVLDRPKELADDKTTSGMVVRHVVQSLEDCESWRADVVIELYACTPVRPPRCLDILVQALVDTKADSAWCAAPVGSCHPVWIVTIDARGRCHKAFAEEKARQDRRDQTPFYYLTGTAFAVRRDVLLGPNDPSNVQFYYGRDRVAVVFPAEQMVDIDEPGDLLWAEFLLSRLPKTPDAP